MPIPISKATMDENMKLLKTTTEHFKKEQDKVAFYERVLAGLSTLVPQSRFSQAIISAEMSLNFSRQS